MCACWRASWDLAAAFWFRFQRPAVDCWLLVVVASGLDDYIDRFLHDAESAEIQCLSRSFGSYW
jgi:hypothetical protein